jgi:nitric oxide reductase activation protein
MFELSDGQPWANNYHERSAVQHTHDSVKKTEKMGFNIVQVCINHSYNPKTMFDHFVILEDMSKLAFDLGKVIKKATLKAAHVHVT